MPIYRNTTEAFWKLVDKSGENGCWNWTGYTRHGYGAIYDHGKILRANRYSWELRHGPIPAGLFVCHHCDNRRCVNPDHLFLGTPKQNMEDAAQKGRMARGEKHPQAKLRSEEVVEIRQLADAGIHEVAIAEIFNISRASVHQIALRFSWKHIPEKSPTILKKIGI